MDVAKYAALFISESREHLQAMNQLLLAWEREPQATAPVEGLFRAIHSIKGMAATMGFTPLADLAHRGENLLDAVRAGKFAVKTEHFELLFRTVDALEAGVAASAAGKPLPREGDALVKALDDEGVKKRLLDLGSVIPKPAERTPESLKKLVDSEITKWSGVLKPLN